LLPNTTWRALSERGGVFRRGDVLVRHELRGRRLGGACKLDTEPKQPDSEPLGYIKLTVENLTKSACITACEAQKEAGCCWHKPNGTDIDTVCQWIKGGSAYNVGGSEVRESTDCV